MESFIKEINDLGLKLSVKGKDLLLTNKEGDLTDEDISALSRNPHIPVFIKENKNGIIEFLNETNFTLNKDNTVSIYELSPSQNGIYFHAIYLSSAEERDYSTNHTQNYIAISSDLDAEIFEKAWDTVIKNHTILRTGFISDKVKVPLQFVYNEVTVPFTFVDYSSFSLIEATEKFDVYRKEDLKKQFVFTNPPLMRITLAKLAESRYMMIWTRHHILLDGWSNQILIKELLSLYECYYRGQKAPLVKEDRFEEHITFLRTIDSYSEKNFWKELFKGFSNPSLLPFTSEIRERNKGNGVFKKKQLQFDANYTKKLLSFSQSLHVTPNTLLQGIWIYLLSEYTSLKDILLGITVSGRPSHGNYDLKVGNFINTLPLRYQFNKSESLTEYFLGIQKLNVELRNYQYSSINNIKEWGDIKGELFDCLWIFNNFPISEQTEKEEQLLKIENIYSEGNNNYLLTILLTLQDKLNIEFTYNSNLIEEEYINMICLHIRHVLDQLITGKISNLDSIELLGADEKEVLINQFNVPEVIFSEHNHILDMFSHQVVAVPNHIAISYHDISLTYAELDAVSNRLANYLVAEANIAKDDFVGISLMHSEWLVVAVFGVIKSGGAYVAIDPKLPVERIQLIKEESSCKLTIDDEFIRVFVQNKEYTDTAPAVEPDSDSLAYVLYTSGSTGIPKGVMIEHSSLSNYLNWAKSYYLGNDLANLNFGLFTTLSFDLTVTSLFLPLISGGTLTIFDSNLGVADLLTEYLSSSISSIKLTPAHINLLGGLGISTCNIELAIIGGDTLDKNQVSILKALNPSMKIYNEYGPTETTVGAVVYDVTAESDRILIGQPIANTNIYILDQQLKLVPIGIAGEIYISGKGLARGYFNSPALTTEKFIDHPFKKGAKLYKTGDLGKWLPNGNIDFLGRNDDQVKIRGFRIELDEIRHHLQIREDISEVVVLAQKAENEDKKILAYIVSKKAIDPQNLREYLADKIPDYMIPAKFLQVDEIPLNNNGKIDQKKLFALDLKEKSVTTIHVLPIDETEIKIAQIWEQILDLSNIGTNDDFFKLGGHSLNVIQLAQQYRKVFAVKVGLKNIFELTTLQSHAHLIKSSALTKFTNILKVEAADSYPVSDGQRRLWALSQFEEGSVAYNMPSQLTLKGAYDIPKFIKAIGATIERHEVLRTVFKLSDDAEVRQYIIPAKDLDFKLDFIDFSNEEDKSFKTARYIKEDSYRTFDLENGPLLRAALIKQAEGEFVFYYNMHHIISDGWSMGILAKDVLAFYESFISYQEPNLPTLNIQYKDYAAWQLKSQANGTNKQYWLNILAGELPLLDLPSNKVRPKIKTYKGSSLRTFLAADATAELKDFAGKNGGSLFTVLLTMLNVLFYRYTLQEDIIIGSPVAGRDHQDLNNQIGFYVNTISLRSQISADDSFNTLYGKVKDNTLRSYDHQSYPFDRLVDDLDLKRDIGRSAIFDILLVLQNTGDKTGPLNITQEEENSFVAIEEVVCKYDMDIVFKEIGQHMAFQVIYNTDVYEKEMVLKMMTHFKNLINVVLRNPKELIRSVPYISAAEKNELLHLFNDNARPYPKETTIIRLFKEQVKINPAQVALRYQDQSLTYLQLDEISGRLASYLTTVQHVQAGEKIGIALERSHWVVISILSILKTGNVYVPVNIDFPQERQQFILADAGCNIAIDRLMLNDFEQRMEEFDETYNIADKTNNIQAAILYTSGSTGRPKGVLTGQKSIINLVKNTSYIKVERGETILCLSNFSFDGATFDVFMPLLNGGVLIISPKNLFSDLEDFNSMLINDKVDSFLITTALFNALVDAQLSALKGLKYILFGGEQVSVSHVKRFKEMYPLVHLHHLYGPSENTTYSTFYEVKELAGSMRTIPIGAAITNTTSYILDADHNLVPIGVVGEICVGGEGLSLGYVNLPELTREKFIKHPFVDDAIIYKTGDYGKWLPGGNIEFVGRKDDQIKIRGHRIELVEIENVMLQLDEIDRALIMVKTDENEKELVAYFVAQYQLKIPELKIKLKNILPHYMIPSYFVQLQEFPITPNGKIDKKLLKSPDERKQGTDNKYVAPGNEIEVKLVSIWEQLLKKEVIGIYDDFFELGGHSLKALRLLDDLHKTFGIKIKIRDLYQKSTVKDLAEEISLALRLVNLQKTSTRTKTMRI